MRIIAEWVFEGYTWHKSGIQRGVISEHSSDLSRGVSSIQEKEKEETEN